VANAARKNEIGSESRYVGALSLAG